MQNQRRFGGRPSEASLLIWDGRGSERQREPEIRQGQPLERIGEGERGHHREERDEQERLRHQVREDEAPGDDVPAREPEPGEGIGAETAQDQRRRGGAASVRSYTFSSCPIAWVTTRSPAAGTAWGRLARGAGAGSSTIS